MRPLKSNLARRLLRFKWPLIALCLATITLGFMPRVFSLTSPDLTTSTSANNVIVQYSLPHHLSPVDTQHLGTPMTPPFTLYGDGTLICGHDSSMPFMDGMDSSTYSLPTSTVLTSTQIHDMLQQIANTGFFSLKKEYYKAPVIEHQDMLRVSLLSGEYYVLYYNDVPAPAAYTNTLNILQNFCQKATQTYSPPAVTLQALKHADPGSAATIDSTAVNPAVAASFTAVMKKADLAFSIAQSDPNSVDPSTSTPAEGDQKLTGSAATAAVQELSGKPTEYVRANGSTYEIGVQLPPPKIKNPLKIDYHKIRQQQAQSGFVNKLKGKLFPKTYADGTTPVRVVLLLASDGGSTDTQAKAQVLGSAVQNWYCGQIGSCYTYQGVSVMTGSQTRSFYTTCHGSDACVGDPLAAVLYNVDEQDAGTIYRNDVDTLLVAGWDTGESRTDNCGLGFVGDTLGIIDLHESPVFCPSGRDLAHEMGHTFGLNHTGNGTLMDGPPYSQSGADCDIANSGMPTCVLDKGQASWRRTSSGYFGVPTPSSTLFAGQRLRPGHQLVSASGAYQLSLQQTDGNLVIYNSAHQATWSNNTAGKSTSFLGMQTDGNLVQYNTSNKPIWATGTKGRGGDHVVIQDDGNLVMLTACNQKVWSINTGLLPKPPSCLTLGSQPPPPPRTPSPAIAGLAGGGVNGGYEIAFQSSANYLWSIGSDGSGGNSGYQMDSGSSPAIAGLAGGGHEIAFQDNNHFLWSIGSNGSGGNSGYQMP